MNYGEGQDFGSCATEMQESIGRAERGNPAISSPGANETWDDTKDSELNWSNDADLSSLSSSDNQQAGWDSQTPDAGQDGHGGAGEPGTQGDWINQRYVGGRYESEFSHDRARDASQGEDMDDYRSLNSRIGGDVGVSRSGRAYMDHVGQELSSDALSCDSVEFEFRFVYMICQKYCQKVGWG